MIPKARRGPSAPGLVPALALAALAVGTLTACGKAGERTSPEPPPPMDLAGTHVMLIPARASAPVALDRELVFWLTERAPRVDWIPPETIRETVASIPAQFGLDAPRRLLDIGSGQLRLQDPLYGDVRRLAAVLDAELAVIPMATSVHSDSLGVTMELAAVVASIHGGRVLWSHTVEGGPAESEASAAAAAAEALARTLIRQ